MTRPECPGGVTFKGAHTLLVVNVAVLTISAGLPFAQKRWYRPAGVKPAS
jgi:peroxiredoxin